VSQYWYFAATLPGFTFGSPPPLSVSEFLDRCRKNLSGQDFAEIESIPALLKSVSRPQGIRSAFLAAFLDWDRDFRNELSRLRAQALETDVTAWLRPASGPVSGGASSAAAACFAAKDPLDAEVSLERERWSCVETLCSLHTFDLDAIAAYRIKLDIDARLAAFDTTLGRESYGRLYHDILGPAQNGAETTSSGVQA